MLISSYLKLKPTLTMARTGTRTPIEVDGAKETPTVEAVEIAILIAETY